MTKNIAARRIGHAGLGSATRWTQAGILGSALLLGGAPAVQAADIGSLIGGVVGGMMAQQQRQYYAPQPQYYQAQPQYYQQQPQYYQQPRYQAQPHRNTSTASTRQKAPRESREEGTGRGKDTDCCRRRR